MLLFYKDGVIDLLEVLGEVGNIHFSVEKCEDGNYSLDLVKGTDYIDLVKSGNKMFLENIKDIIIERFFQGFDKVNIVEEMSEIEYKDTIKMEYHKAIDIVCDLPRHVDINSDSKKVVCRQELIESVGLLNRLLEGVNIIIGGVK